MGSYLRSSQSSELKKQALITHPDACLRCGVTIAYSCCRAGGAGTDGFTAPPAARVGTIYCKHSNTNCDVTGLGSVPPPKLVSMRQLHSDPLFQVCGQGPEPSIADATVRGQGGGSQILWLVSWGPRPSAGSTPQANSAGSSQTRGCNYRA